MANQRPLTRQELAFFATEFTNRIDWALLTSAFNREEEWNYTVYQFKALVQVSLDTFIEHYDVREGARWKELSEVCAPLCREVYDVEDPSVEEFKGIAMDVFGFLWRRFMEQADLGEVMGKYHANFGGSRDWWPRLEGKL